MCKKKQEHENTKKRLADRYNRLLRMLGKDMVERLVQDDIRTQGELEAKKQKEQMSKKIGGRIK